MKWKYKNGKRERNYIEYNQNGKIWKKCYYVNGLLNKKNI
jgi:antitoxin component YwqK of YwqJK toxin-antitoxin module